MTVDGIAASIASVIAMAGDEVVMPVNSMMMMHNPMGMGPLGNAEDMRKSADDLDRVREGLIAAYDDKANIGRDRIIGYLDGETWFTAREAVEAGFADRVEERAVTASMATKDLLVINGLGVQLDRYDTRPSLEGILRKQEPQIKAPGGIAPPNQEQIAELYQAFMKRSI